MAGSTQRVHAVCRAIEPTRSAHRLLIHSGGHRESPVWFGWKPFNRTEDPVPGLDPGMTNEMMSLRTLLEKSADADLLRELDRRRPWRAQS